MLFSAFSTRRHGHTGQPLKLSFVDIRKAYFNGTPKRKMFLHMPGELGLPKHVVGYLVRCAYGTRDAGAIWEETFAGALVAIGFERGAASACCFYHTAKDIAIVVHGDDFTALGEDEDLNWYESELSKYFELKIRGRVGPEASDDKEMRILNRILRIDSEGLKYEADPRHAEIIVKSLGIESAKPVISPGVKTPFDEDDNVMPNDPPDLVAALNKLERSGKCSQDSRVVNFSSIVETFEITPYSETYDVHPSKFVVNHRGMKRI